MSMLDVDKIKKAFDDLARANGKFNAADYELVTATTLHTKRKKVGEIFDIDIVVDPFAPAGAFYLMEKI